MSYFVFFCWLFICKLGWGRGSFFVCYRLFVIMWFLFGEVSSSTGCSGWAALFYWGTPRAFNIIIFHKGDKLKLGKHVYGINLYVNRFM